MKISNKDLNRLVSESVKKVLKEYTYRYNTGVFSDNAVLNKLEKIIYIIECDYINYDSETNTVKDWSDFVEGMIDLYDKSKELVWFKKYHIKEMSLKYDENSDMSFEDFLSENNIPYDWNWLYEYLNDTEKWEETIPTPEEIYKMIEEFISWIEVYYDIKEENIVKELNAEKRYIISTLNNNIY